jgi:hypothetical protein
MVVASEPTKPEYVAETEGAPDPKTTEGLLAVTVTAFFAMTIVKV